VQVLLWGNTKRLLSQTACPVRSGGNRRRDCEIGCITQSSLVPAQAVLPAYYLVGHVLDKDWEVLSIPAIETEDREYRLGPIHDDIYWREEGEVLQIRDGISETSRHPGRAELPFGAAEARSTSHPTVGLWSRTGLSQSSCQWTWEWRRGGTP
jgi:hypothetical protein